MQCTASLHEAALNMLCTISVRGVQKKTGWGNQSRVVRIVRVKHEIASFEPQSYQNRSVFAAHLQLRHKAFQEVVKRKLLFRTTSGTGLIHFVFSSPTRPACIEYMEQMEHASLLLVLQGCVEDYRTPGLLSAQIRLISASTTRYA